jgi:hypothetical protein
LQIKWDYKKYLHGVVLHYLNTGTLIKIIPIHIGESTTKHYAMKAYGEVNIYVHVFLTSGLVGGEWSASRPCRFTPGERAPGT